MKYKAELLLTQPSQWPPNKNRLHYNVTYGGAERWGKEILKAAPPGSTVKIYETREMEVGFLEKQPEDK